MSNHLKVSALFGPTCQGEGPNVGVASIFLRTFGCNFTCSSFGMPPGEKSQERHQIDASKIKTIQDIIPVNTGCDSFYSWDPRFKHLGTRYDIDELVAEIKKLLPNGNFMQASGNDIHLVVTGGEPLLGWQRAYADLFNELKKIGLENVTFETNGTQELQQSFVNFFNSDYEIAFTFSISPKLSASGEAWEDAIKPKIVSQYSLYGYTYLKFVIDREEHFEEVDRAVAEYREAGFDGPVYIMPEGGTADAYNKNATKVADWTLGHGYYFSPRLHIVLWKNRVDR